MRNTSSNASVSACRATIRPSDFRASAPRFAAEARAANHAVVNLLSEVAREKCATPAQVALAWLLAQKPWIVPIPGTRHLSRLEENLAAGDVTLSAQELERIDTAASAIQIAGARYSEAAERMVDR